MRSNISLALLSSVCACFLATAATAQEQQPAAQTPPASTALPTADGVAVIDSGSSSSAIVIPLPAAATRSCTTTVTFGGYNSYAYQDLGIEGSKNPVTQGDVLQVCDGGKYVFDKWVSAGGTKNGNRGADEIDLTGHRNDQFVTPIGPVKLETTFAYDDFNFEGLGKLHDDIFDIHADFSRPFKVGSPFGAGDISLAPFFRYTRIQWIEQSKHLTFVRPGIRGIVPVTPKWTLIADFSPDFDTKRGTEVNRSQIDLAYSAGHGWTLKGDLRLTTHDRPMLGGSIGKTF